MELFVLLIYYYYYMNLTFLRINIEEYQLQFFTLSAIKILYLSSVTVLYKITELPYTLTRPKLKHRNKILLHFTTTNEGWDDDDKRMTNIKIQNFKVGDLPFTLPKFITKQIRI